MSDPLDELRDQWRALDPPRADAEPDARTRAALDWTRAAWSSLEPPLAHVPQPVARRAAWPFALAGALAAAGIVLWLTWRSAQGTSDGPDVAVRDHVAPSTPDQPRAPDAEDTPGAVPTPSPGPPPEETPARILADGSVELRRGSVRLILFDPPNDNPQ